jgi:ABC-type transport system involved in cytochrome c biogenesis permease subunit
MAIDSLADVTQRGSKPLLATQWLGGEPATFTGIMRSAFQSLASLKLTVVLFAMSIFIIWVGTLAQVDKDMWEVIALYFRAKICWIPVTVLFPRTWFPHLGEPVMRVLVALPWLILGTLGVLPYLQRRTVQLSWLLGGGLLMMFGVAAAVQAAAFGGFFFPGGALIGAALAVNLLAAHALRFRIKAGGVQLLFGLLLLAVGCFLTWLVIAGGHSHTGLQDEPLFSYEQLWLWCKSALTVFTAATCGLLVYMLARARHRIIELVIVASIAVLVGPFCGWLWLAGDSAYLGDAGMRILWQLIQGGLSGLVLLAGCLLVFKRRGPIVLIHAGLGLMMFGELFVTLYAVEERLVIREGETISYAIDIREPELAVVDPSYSETQEDVIAIPRSLLLDSLRNERPIQHPDLPFGIQVEQYVKNSDLRRAAPDDTNPATAGYGVNWMIEDVRASSGADASGAVDMASAYVTLLDKDSGQKLDTYVVSQLLAAQGIEQQVPVDGRTYDMSLRFKRTYKPYAMTLIDVRKDDYIGTSTPKNYSSDVRLVDASRDVDREIKIWMNNPLRYAGETFYQSGYNRDPRSGQETTTLQVVTNTGWMIPYVACMLVTVGLLVHFPNILLRFLKQRDEQLLADADSGSEAAAVQPQPKKANKRSRSAPAAPGPSSIWNVVFPVLVVTVMFLWVGSKARPASVAKDGFDLAAFGTLPVVDQGRVKPIDTLARNVLTKISDRDSFRDDQDRRQSALRWFLDSVARPEQGQEHRVFRIHNLEVLDTLGLPRRKGFRYSLAEIRANPERLEEFDRQTTKAGELDTEQLSFYQRKLLEVSQRFQSYMRITEAFQPWDLPDFPGEDQLQEDRQAAINTWIQQTLAAANAAERRMQMIQAPLPIPDVTEGDAAAANGQGKPWEAYATAYSRAQLKQTLLKEDVQFPVLAWSTLLDAYHRGDHQAFNQEVVKYRQALAANPPVEYSGRKVRFESYFNHLAPFYHSMVLYLVAFVLASFSWLGFSRPMNRAAFWLIVLAFVVHSFGLVARIYISGRPPVTNLYSSAVFIAWLCVLGGLILEVVFRMGVGNIVATVGGFVTLMIALFLGRGSDTFTVMQAVLDTQFWLATHVVFITKGYAAVFIAGLLGIIFILGGFFTRAMDKERARLLTRMTYGVVSYALIFSLVGTVLGGLWADDSWGRFWGWDPKENGALMIVLWTALILHARWDGMIRQRGLAVLAVGGNIITAWSWFGVNELGVGLHSYGFTEGVLLALGLFVLSQLAIIVIGCLPPRMWMSFHNGDPPRRLQTA